MAPTWPEPVRRDVLTGWGRTAPTGGSVAHPAFDHELESAVARADARGTIARGLGRSYGDAAQRAGGCTVEMTGLDQVALDPVSGVVRADAGVSLDELLRILVPRGWFVPVTPGTREVTVGGAVAADIHGKDHHVRGTFCAHVDALSLLLADGTTVTTSPTDDPDLFWATAGGMGLTGIIRSATFRCLPIESSRLLVDTDRCADLDEVMAKLSDPRRDHPYSVAWIDLVATGAATGRSVLTTGRFASADEAAEAGGEPLAYAPRTVLAAPPWVPAGLLNRLTIRAFNELWFRRAPEHRRDELQTIATFFHPLDGVRGWNRLYGTPGFVQWQCVLPDGAEPTLRGVVERISTSGSSSFLAVLKRFGPADPGPLSFPDEGWTLALDVPVTGADLGDLLDELDRLVAGAGGRIYLAKDARMRPELLPVMYPRLDEWREVRVRVDPDRVLRSDLSERLGL